jgi:hypothetical protein
MPEGNEPDSLRRFRALLVAALVAAPFLVNAQEPAIGPTPVPGDQSGQGDQSTRKRDFWYLGLGLGSGPGRLKDGQHNLSLSEVAGGGSTSSSTSRWASR